MFSLPLLFFIAIHKLKVKILNVIVGILSVDVRNIVETRTQPNCIFFLILSRALMSQRMKKKTIQSLYEKQKG